MRVNLPRLGTYSVSKRTISYVLFVLLIAAGLIVWRLHIQTSKHKASAAVGNTAPTLAEQTAAGINSGKNNLQKKDYQAAVDSYVNASATAFYQKDYQHAKAILQECINNVPDANVPWYLYSTLAEVAKNLNDTTLEKDSLQKAITKATQSSSGVSPETITNLQKSLQGIK